MKVCINTNNNSILPGFINVQDDRYFEKDIFGWWPKFGECAIVNVTKNGKPIGDGTVEMETPFQMVIKVNNGSYIRIDLTNTADVSQYEIKKIQTYFFISSTGGVHETKIGKNPHDDRERYDHYNMFDTKSSAERVRDNLIKIMKNLNPDKGNIEF
jgi:hypothetical protein